MCGRANGRFFFCLVFLFVCFSFSDVQMRQCSWIPKQKGSSPTQFQAHERMVGQWIRWMMNELIIPLIKNHFYVTESAVHKNKVFYFRKPLWKQIVNADLGRNDGVSRIKDMFSPLSDEQARPLLQNSFHLPASQLRLLPKVPFQKKNYVALLRTPKGDWNEIDWKSFASVIDGIGFGEFSASSFVRGVEMGAAAQWEGEFMFCVLVFLFLLCFVLLFM
jgi:hypothetical protein